MNIIPLARCRYGSAKDQETDKETWTTVLNEFPQRVRSEAANLAAHSWDVTLAGERLLVSCSWYKAQNIFWYEKDGERTPVTEDELDQLYPVVPESEKYYDRATTQSDKARRCTIQTDWLNG